MNIFTKRSKEKKQIHHAASPIEINNLKVLGVPLKEAVKNNPTFDGQPIPAIVRLCIDFVNKNGLRQEGIYRVSPPKMRLDVLEKLINQGRYDEITFYDAHENITGLLKRFLRQLSDIEHILNPLKQEFIDRANECTCKDICRCPIVTKLKELLLSLPIENITLLAYIFRHSHMVIQEAGFNKMSLPAIGVLLQAMLNLQSSNIIRIFILNATYISDSHQENMVQLFDSVSVKRYSPPKSVKELEQSPPCSKEELEEEIFKQQNLMTFLHDRLRATSVDNTSLRSTQDQMWVVQQGITMLKRQLKSQCEASSKDEEQQNQTTHESDSQCQEKQQSDKKSTDEITVSISPALLEKHLWAVNTSLREEITDEKRQIGHLLSILRKLTNQLPEEFQPMSSVQNNDTPWQDAINTSNTDEYSEEEAKLECRRDELLDELIRYRNICAQLRARLEHKTMILRNLQSSGKNVSKPPPDKLDDENQQDDLKKITRL